MTKPAGGRPARFDLNLLVPLNALLQEASVTRAAQRVGLSQPACSAVLRRLREHFDDALLVRGAGHRMQLTPLAQRIRERASVLAADIDSLVSTSTEPELIEREFTVMLVDAEAAFIIPQLVQLLDERAPGASLRVQPPHPAAHASFADEVRRVDVAIVPSYVVSNTLPSQELYDDEWVLVSDGIKGVELPGDIDELLRRRWVLCFDHPPTYWSPARTLEQEGRRLSVAARTDCFTDLMLVVNGTSTVGLAPRCFAASHGGPLGIRLSVPPPPLPRQLTLSMAWHPVHNYDLTHAWFRSLVSEAAERRQQEPCKQGGA